MFVFTRNQTCLFLLVGLFSVTVSAVTSPQAPAASEQSIVAAPNPHDGIIIQRGYVADSDNVRDPNLQYGADGNKGAEERTTQNDMPYPEELDYYNEESYYHGNQAGHFSAAARR